MNARIPGQLLHELDLDDEEEDELQACVQRAQRLLDLIDGDRARFRYDRLGELVAQAKTELDGAASHALIRWMAMP
ncbi:hypothetical protein [Pseudorhodoferax sp. Leaf265]|uniref:hypothetical protein n=1 Tax=Pseudorhodoferax sp. Leaf265 TaxID=1736315 RepID=UPI0006FEE38D|nr:hypothetical protein [Pseudorhodoferax sp. Leaf265]KQP02492.1 hypothetical protein ASF45_20780 [Pseudorhodoferax sp. Leaf265]